MHSRLNSDGSYDVVDGSGRIIATGLTGEQASRTIQGSGSDSGAGALGCILAGMIIIFLIFLPIGYCSLLWQSTLLDKDQIRRVTRWNHFVTFGGLLVTALSIVWLVKLSVITFHPLAFSDKNQPDFRWFFAEALLVIGLAHLLSGIITYFFARLNTRIGDKYPDRVSQLGVGWLNLIAVANNGKPRLLFTRVQDFFILALGVVWLGFHPEWPLYLVGYLIICLVATKWWIGRATLSN